MPKSNPKLLLRSTYFCNNNCIFCSISGLRMKETPPLEFLKSAVNKSKYLGCKTVIITGGEPSIRKDLLKLIRFIRKQGMEVEIFTNARVFKNYENALKVERLVSKYIVSLHSHDASVHDSLTRAQGSFIESTIGIRNLLEKGSDIMLNMVIAKSSQEPIEFVNFVSKEFPNIRDIKFAYPSDVGSSCSMKILPRLEESARKIKEAIIFGKKKGLRIFYENVPLCLIESGRNHIYEREEHGIAFISEGTEKISPIRQIKKKEGLCNYCHEKENCRGVYQRYEGINPFLKKVQNSFNFDDDIRFLGEISLCDKRKLISWDEDPMYSIILNTNEGKIIYNTSNKDHDTVKKVKEDYQIFALKGEGRYPKDLYQLRPITACSDCMLRIGKCPGIYNISDSNILACSGVNKKISELIASSKGKMLDIGFGETIYLDSIRKFLHHEENSYSGIDPESEKVKLFREDLIPFLNAEVFEGRFESFNFEDKYFDIILMLRSLNHLYDPLSAISKISKILSKGGNLIISENPVYGLINLTSKKKQIGENEHFNNFDMEGIKRILQERGFRIICAIKEGPKEPCWFINAIKLAEKGEVG